MFGVFPLQYAIESLCFKNLETLIKAAKANAGNHKDFFYSIIINTKSPTGDNYLSFLIQHMDNGNQDDVCEMIKLMLLNGCNVNHPNIRSETPFFLMLAKFQNIPDKHRLITFSIDNAKVDFHAHKGADIIRMMEACGLGGKVASKSERKIDMEMMTEQLDNNAQSAFVQLFDEFRANSKDFHFEITKLLQEAIVRGLCRTVTFLVHHGADINEASVDLKLLELTPAELACVFGHHEVLNVLLQEPNLKFRRSDDSQVSLLHKILSARNVHEIDRQKCFDLLIVDERCTMGIINGADKNDQTPLSLACLHGFSDIAEELLHRGAYIGHNTIISNIDKDLLESFLDDCVMCSSDVSDKNCEVHVDFRFLMPPNVDDRVHSEMLSIFSIADNKNLDALILHPVMSIYLALQWRKISGLVYFFLLVHFGFLLFYGWFVVTVYRYEEPKNITYKHYQLLVFRDADNNVTKDYDNWINTLSIDFIQFEWEFCICMLGMSLIALNEFVQCVVAFRKYFTKISNYLDLSFVLISAYTFYCYHHEVEYVKEVRATTILVIAAQCIQVITQVSALSISLHMTIFKRVCSTFLQTLSLYMILIVAFAMSFHSLHEDEKIDERLADRAVSQTPRPQILKRIIKTFHLNGETGETVEHERVQRELNFSDFFSSVIITVRMMTSDFESFQFNNNMFHDFLFLLFVILISIVLLNLLNALTISDTNNILRDAELVEAKKTVSILKSYEKIFMVLRLSFANILPKMSLITLKPNLSQCVVIKQATRFNDDSSFAIHSEKHKRHCFDKCRGSIQLTNKLIMKVREFVKVKQEQTQVDLKFEKIFEDQSRILKFLEMK